ncbi:MAG: hypothetical protein MZV70_33870 [Desulfobacterales bacterium]|nr:hypothetical protein [Desulfobacterales bacterium]
MDFVAARSLRPAAAHSRSIVTQSVLHDRQAAESMPALPRRGTGGGACRSLQISVWYHRRTAQSVHASRCPWPTQTCLMLLEPLTRGSMRLSKAQLRTGSAAAVAVARAGTSHRRTDDRAAEELAACDSGCAMQRRPTCT